MAEALAEVAKKPLGRMATAEPQILHGEPKLGMANTTKSATMAKLGTAKLGRTCRHSPGTDRSLDLRAAGSWHPRPHRSPCWTDHRHYCIPPTET